MEVVRSLPNSLLCSAKIEDLLPIETVVVISKTGDKIKFDIGYDKITL